MIELIRFRAEAPAQLFAAYLRSEGMQVRLAHQSDHTALYVEADQVDQAREHLDAFLDNPADPRFQAAAWASGTPMAAQRTQQAPLFSGQWLGRTGPVTRTVFFVCVAVFLSGMVTPVLYQAFLFAPSLDMLWTQPWRLLTPMFLHLSLLHIVFNMLWWVDLAGLVERYQSSAQLVLVMLVTSAIANLAQFWDTGANFGGMSGVVYGLLGYLWLYGKTNPAAGYALRKEIVIFMLVWLVICWVGFADVIANAAHLAGLVSGCVLGVLTGVWRRWRYYA